MIRLLYRCYTACWYILLPFVLLRLLLRSRKNPAYRERWKERFGYIDALPRGRPVVWVHAVSVGESIAALPLIKQLLVQYPAACLMMTTTTPTGSVLVQESLVQWKGRAYHVYLPYDFPYAIKRFLKAVNPSLCLIMETELWPNLLKVVSQVCPIALINARLSERSYLRYQRVAMLSQYMLQQLQLILTQTQADADRFEQLGACPEQIKVAGNLKFANQAPEQVSTKLKDLFKEKIVLTIASTHDDEEAVVLSIIKQLQQQIPNLLLVIAPRHPERCDAIKKLIKQHQLSVVEHTDYRPSQNMVEDIAIYLVNTIGDLNTVYTASDLVLIGGSLIERGGHNVFEPAMLGKAVLIGESHYNFQWIVDQLVAHQACEVVNRSTLLEKVQFLLKNKEKRQSMGENGRSFIMKYQTIVDDYLAYLAMDNLLLREYNSKEV